MHKPALTGGGGFPCGRRIHFDAEETSDGCS